MGLPTAVGVGLVHNLRQRLSGPQMLAAPDRGSAVNVAALTQFPNGRRSPIYSTWLLLPAILLGTAGMAAPNRWKILSYYLVFLLVAGCVSQVACGGGSNPSRGSGGMGGRLAGTYTVSVTRTAGSTQPATTVMLTVQ